MLCNSVPGHHKLSNTYVDFSLYKESPRSPFGVQSQFCFFCGHPILLPRIRNRSVKPPAVSSTVEGSGTELPEASQGGMRVIALLAMGLTTHQIAERVGVKLAVVHNYVHLCYRARWESIPVRR
jgi:hypothetical protein